MFPVRYGTGNLTNGEAKVFAALASEVEYDELEVFLVIVFKHNDPGNHEVILTGNITHSAEATRGLLHLAALTVKGSGETGGTYAPNPTDHKVHRFCGHIRARRFPFHR